MADAGFTPGPWSYHPYGNPEVRPCEANGPAYRYADMCIGAGDRIVATVEMRRGAEPGGYPTVECEHEMAANAALIKAAPELYEALVEMKKALWLECRSLWNLDDFNNFAAVQQANAALAKARGGQ